MRRWPGTVIRWIDRDLASSYRPGRLSLFVPLLVPIFLSGLASGLSGALRLAALAGIATLTVGWLALFAWRATIAIRAFALKGDRAYDQRIKRGLPPEYAGTESATAARAKRRRKR